MKRRRLRTIARWSVWAILLPVGAAPVLLLTVGALRDVDMVLWGGYRQPQARVVIQSGGMTIDWRSVGRPPQPRLRTTPATPFLHWLPTLHLWTQLGRLEWTLVLPFWIPCLAITAPIVTLWILSLRRKPWQCRCGYDLRGLTAGTCPECGHRAEAVIS